MKLTTEMRQELADGLAQEGGVKVIDEFCAEQVEQIAPIIERWLDKYEAALTTAESFVSGFEGYEMPEGVDDMLAQVRALLFWGPSGDVCKLRVVYRTRGAHTHMEIRTGPLPLGIGLSLAGCITLTNDEFALWRQGRARIEFVDGDAQLR